MMMPLYQRPGALQLTAELLAASGLPPASRLLDGGCGSGATVAWLRQQGYDAWGIDRSVDGTAEAAGLQKGELTQLPWPEQSFDGYITECTLSVCGNARLALVEAQRVLRPGGRLLIADVYEKAAGSSTLLDHEGWQHLLEETGFTLLWWADRSAYWKHFVVEALWAGQSLEQLTCGLSAGKVGYLILVGSKREADGR